MFIERLIRNVIPVSSKDCTLIKKKKERERKRKKENTTRTRNQSGGSIRHRSRIILISAETYVSTIAAHRGAFTCVKEKRGQRGSGGSVLFASVLPLMYICDFARRLPGPVYKTGLGGKVDARAGIKRRRRRALYKKKRRRTGRKSRGEREREGEGGERGTGSSGLLNRKFNRAFSTRSTYVPRRRSNFTSEMSYNS